MEYIPGKSGTQLLEATSEPTEREAVYRQMALGIQELLRIPIPPNPRPTAIDGGLIRHIIFEQQEAPRPYQSVDQLEQHFNLFLQWTKREPKILGLSREPMVFCHSDAWPGNFIINKQGHVTVVDFSEVSILPSSFAKYAITPSVKDHEYSLLPWIDVPSTDGVDNTRALFAATNPMIMGAGSFAKAGKRIPGYDRIPSPIPPVS
ncbi:uncharacterized protein GIQ15_05510 [Arthroderma uncinatum]|uniref:uncharacterized protein n=1 Tax=Arthroderma uncinatum TaxID=74035 RepID=UPI00144AEA82|nr:uncharacterized protein GIQ15_05510 [Arthroderma uncinatum]KAF3480163.1 hypothetical protein GIQ15_05510 [Arthroderma uncinatum]